MNLETRCIAFEGPRRIAAGALAEVALAAKTVIDRGGREPVLIFYDRTSEQIELDLRGTPKDVLARLAKSHAAAEPPAQPASARGPGRPKLGVVAREVTLLPRHWEWLARQRGGASVALRKLVEDARRSKAGEDRVRHSQEAAYRFMSTMAGNQPGFEEATRALFASNAEGFQQHCAQWPADVRDHATALAAESFSEVAAVS